MSPSGLAALGCDHLAMCPKVLPGVNQSTQHASLHQPADLELTGPGGVSHRHCRQGSVRSRPPSASPASCRSPSPVTPTGRATVRAGPACREEVGSQGQQGEQQQHREVRMQQPRPGELLGGKRQQYQRSNPSCAGPADDGKDGSAGSGHAVSAIKAEPSGGDPLRAMHMSGVASTARQLVSSGRAESPDEEQGPSFMASLLEPLQLRAKKLREAGGEGPLGPALGRPGVSIGAQESRVTACGERSGTRVVDGENGCLDGDAGRMSVESSEDWQAVLARYRSTSTSL
jgi:hypothetical protein